MTTAALEPAAQRTAAPADYIARRLNHFITPPIPGTRTHLVEACRAELEWATHDWKQTSRFGGWESEAAMLAEAQRLPHERAAAKVINAHGHMDTFEWLMRKALQRRDIKTFDGYRDALRRALVAYRRAGAEYRALRQEAAR